MKTTEDVSELGRRVEERTAALTREVAERKEIEAELRRRDAVQRILTETTARLFAASDWTAIVGDVLRAIGEVVAADRVHVFECGRSANGNLVGRLRFEWTAPGVAGQIDNPLVRELPLDSPSTERWVKVLGRGDALHALAREMPKAERDLAMALDVRAVLMVPILVDDTWWGGIGFVDARAERTWNDIDVQALRVVAGALGTAIRRARDEKALRDSGERLRGAVESLQEEFALFDAEDRLVLCNSAFRRRHPAAERAIEEGWRYETLLRADVEAGFLMEAVGREETFIEERLDRHRNPQGSILRTFADGSVSLIKESRTAEGGIALTFADVTQLQRTNAALEAAKTEAETARALLQDALESTTEAFALYDSEGRLAIFNRAYRDLYRHSPELLTPGVNFETILRDRLRQGMVPDLEGDGEAWVQWRLQTFLRASGSVERAFPGGTWWKVNEQRTANGGIAQIATDITAIKAREEALAAAKTEAETSKALLQDALASLSDSFALFDSHGRLVAFNRVWETLFAESSDLLRVGDTYEDILRERGRRGLIHDFPDDPDGWMRWRMDIFWNERGPIERIFPNGRWWRFIEKRTTDGGVAQIATEITAIKAREEATQRLQDQLAHVTRVSTMGQMATGFAHELNQPLTAIANYAQGCLRRHRSGAISADDFVRVTELIVAQAHRSGDIIRRIRRFVQKEPQDVRPVDVNAAIREAVGLVGGEALRHDVDIRLDLADDLPAAEADPIQLQQVILNLARNAIEAIGESGGQAGRLRLATRLFPPEQVEVLVTDSGPGIDAAVQKSIFDPFFTTKASGMGMGLPICRSIAESFGGQLALQGSSPGETTFRMVLKVADEPTAPA
jgi:C4-dicarboxylate-specific signal transduction histidine kinase